MDREKIVKTFEQQLAESKNENIKVIAKYLLSRDDMAEKIQNEEKTLDSMFDYVMKKAKSMAVNQCAMVDDAIVYGWAVHYYDEENSVLEKEVGKLDKERAENNAVKPCVAKSSVLKKEKVKETDNANQFSLF